MTITTNRPLTKLEVAPIGEAYGKYYWSVYTAKRVKQYIYRGEVRERTETYTTEKGKAIRDLLKAYPIFRCPCCHKAMTYTDLESWLTDLDGIVADECACSCCYEDEMGDDL